ncbi:hypothetical protein L9F63_006508 [Diploptera punctata]|uniref:C2H2-type domain-containing protein n=1 Tax=Diploptera punctata TaxID=6984 RepID=A0AAD7ZA28_DIPPU|nr:hypothetical protein L9F63_006508 [Diploptera punctata]
MEKQKVSSTENIHFEVKQEIVIIKQEVFEDDEADEQNENIFGDETYMGASKFCEVKTEIESNAEDNDENSGGSHHIQDNHGKQISSCENNVEFCDKFPKNRNSTAPRPHKCKICNKGFTEKSNLTVHYRWHSGLRPFQCDVCKKGFTQSSGLNRHYRIHTGYKPFECDTCGKSFSQRSGLVAHYRLHTGSRPYICNFCNRTFIRSSQLTVHLRTHTGARPYECDICKKSFSRKEILKGHMVVHEVK